MQFHQVIFGNNYSMEPINLAEVPGPRFQQVCYICDEKGDDTAKRQGACMQCNVQVRYLAAPDFG